jgi:hypothetical protein
MQTQLQSKVDRQHFYRVAMVSCIVRSEQIEQRLHGVEAIWRIW